jgi:hypothetical protein
VLSEFETRLANVLGTRLAPPLAGAVDVAPGRDSARIVLSVRAAQPVDDDLLSLRPERVPGDVAPRRVVKLRCEVGLEMRVPAGGDRADQMGALDQALYLLGDASFRDGSALLPDDDSDPGFLIRRLQLTRSEPPAAVTLDAEGFFWPVGVGGVSGPAIREARIRQASLPLRLVPERPDLVAAGAPLDLRVEFGATGTLRVDAEGGVSRLPYGSVVVSVVDAGGRPGAGALAGGTAGPGGARVLPLADGIATLQYTPPAQATVDHLVVRLEDNEGGAGIELGRFRLAVRGA